MAWDKFNVRNPQIRDELDGIFTGDSLVEAIDVTSLKIGGTAVTKTAAEINGLSNTDVISEKTPVNAVAASGTLTLTGVVIDGETVTVADDTYEFAADAAQSVTSGNVAVDITANTTASSGTLTVDTQPVAGNELVLGDKTFTFVTAGTANADGEISIGADVAAAKVNIVAAILGTDGHNVAHTQVSCPAEFTVNTLVVTALVGGVAGDAIASTITAVGANAFAAVTLGSGADCTAANAITAIVAADAGADYTLADGAGDTVTVTGDTKGVVGNAYASTETLTNGSFAAATLTGGVNGTAGTKGELYADASYLYFCTAANTISGANWRRVSLGSAY